MKLINQEKEKNSQREKLKNDNINYQKTNQGQINNLNNNLNPENYENTTDDNLNNLNNNKSSIPFSNGGNNEERKKSYTKPTIIIIT